MEIIHESLQNQTATEGLQNQTATGGEGGEEDEEASRRKKKPETSAKVPKEKDEYGVPLELYEKRTTSHLDLPAMWRLLEHCGWYAVRKKHSLSDLYYHVLPKYKGSHNTVTKVETLVYRTDYFISEIELHAYITQKVLANNRSSSSSSSSSSGSFSNV